LETYHDVRAEWASISKKKKELMLEERKALTQQFRRPLRILFSPHTCSLKTMLSIKVNEGTKQKCSILPPLSVKDDRMCNYAFMLCPTEHFP
jgi:hypothetical protein